MADDEGPSYERFMVRQAKSFGVRGVGCFFNDRPSLAMILFPWWKGLSIFKKICKRCFFGAHRLTLSKCYPLTSFFTLQVHAQYIHYSEWKKRNNYISKLLFSYWLPFFSVYPPPSGPELRTQLCQPHVHGDRGPSGRLRCGPADWGSTWVRRCSAQDKAKGWRKRQG